MPQDIRLSSDGTVFFVADLQSDGLYMIEDVFKQMAGEVEKFANLSLSKIGDLGVQVLEIVVNTPG